MTREEAIKILSPNSKSGLARDVDGFSPTQKVLCALEMAIAALHSQKTPAKLDRSRWEGCWSCNNQKARKLGLRHGREYCPCCGKPLTGQAWAELERRIGGNNGTDDR